jgi:hypothetical protein
MKINQYTQKWTDLDTEKWTDLWLTKEYEPDEWERTKWEKLREMEEYKEIQEKVYEPYFELSGDEYQLFEEWRDITAAAETNPALQDLLDQAKIIYRLTKIK